MKIKELIEILKNFDKDAEIKIEDKNGDIIDIDKKGIYEVDKNMVIFSTILM